MDIKNSVLITWIIVICYVVLIASSCTISQEDTGLHEETDSSEETSSLLEEKTKTSSTPEEPIAKTNIKCRTIPSGYLELTVLPAKVYAETGEQVEIYCSIESLINTPVNISSVEVILLNSFESLLREQAMTMDSHWSAHTTYTIVGDEDYYRLKVNFTTPYAENEEYSEYTDYSFPIIVN